MTFYFICPKPGLRPSPLEMVSQTISETATTLAPQASQTIIPTGGQS